MPPKESSIVLQTVLEGFMLKSADLLFTWETVMLVLFMFPVKYVN